MPKYIVVNPSNVPTVVEVGSTMWERVKPWLVIILFIALLALAGWGEVPR